MINNLKIVLDNKKYNKKGKKITDNGVDSYKQDVLTKCLYSLFGLVTFVQMNV